MSCFRYTNERQSEGSKINAFYSTPSCYVKAVHGADIEWPTKSDDFFPYESDYHSFWTGYFTSRPTQKRYEREGNHFLQVCKQLSAIAPMKESFYESHLTALREVMGVMQHHDAITGTEKQHVADLTEFVHNFTFLSESLPPNVHLLTVEPWKDDTMLLRFEHLFEKGEDSQYSLPIQINVQDLFVNVNVVSLQETTLAGNQWKEESIRLDYGQKQNKNTNRTVIENKFIVELKPMEIRTFVIRLEKKK